MTIFFLKVHSYLEISFQHPFYIPCAFVNSGLLQAPLLPPNLASKKKSTTPYYVK
jgi:hypothetical protein